MIITENQLDEWVRGNARDAQGVIVELVWRLVAASSPKPKERRFPLGDSIGQPGPDGFLDTGLPFPPFVPEGRSFWEIGTGLRTGAKATTDYRDQVAVTTKDVRHESAFVFVTPLSGRRDWPYTWKKDAQAKWLEERRKRGDWREVKVVDGTKLIDWLSQFPSVELWLADRMGIPIKQIETPEQRWSVLRTIGEPPPLTPQVFLTNRDKASAKLKEVFAGTTVQLKLETLFPDQVVDFISAAIAEMDDESRIDVLGRCLIVSGADAWKAVTTQSNPQVLVADFDLNGADGTTLLQKARRAGHAVIFGGIPGGVPHPNCESIPSPKINQLKAALEAAGYSEERARVLSRKSSGNLSTLLRCLQNLSLMPEWAEGTLAADLAIAELLGAWNENLEADRVTVEGLSGKAYGEWIGKMREVAQRPSTPLTLRDGIWKFGARYEGWYALGSRLFDEHLERVRKTAVDVLREEDPKFELPGDERFAAGIHGKVLSHSASLREGLADTLALLGSQPKALTSCSTGKAEATAVLAVREILTGANWVTWASLNDLLPLLAEAAPAEFLNAVDNALAIDPGPFDEVFAQEDFGAMGATYINGLLWALELLAWDAEYLTRVVVTLGELAARDPGGNWSNRPANSLSNILMPWLPQTNAPIDTRVTAVRTLLQEFPDVGWRLLLSLLPQSHSMSAGSHRPRWREIIRDGAPQGVTRAEYWEQVDPYAGLAVNAATTDLAKLIEVIDRVDDLPSSVHDQLLEYLGSKSVRVMPETDRVQVWNELIGLVTKHRKFADSDWAMRPEQVDRIAEIAERLAPVAPEFRHQRLFGEQELELFEEVGSYADQEIALDKRRQRAVNEIAAEGGAKGVLAFAETVESPWRVGMAYGMVADNDVDPVVLPSLLDTEQDCLAQFAAGFVLGRFRNRGWQWVDKIDTARWAPAQVGQFLAYLPFTSEAWERSARLLGADESAYWSKTTANPYQADNGLELAVDRLIDHDRPTSAIRCLFRMANAKKSLVSDRAIRALLAAPSSSESPRAVDAHDITQVIKALQDDPSANPDGLFQVEWAYLQLLDGHLGVFPVSLERRLADDPRFFCEVIRLVFRSRNKERPVKTPTEHEGRIAAHAYQLLTKWRIPPGELASGNYDGDTLAAWLSSVKKESTATGHFEVAMMMVGHVLTHAPADPDGLWINRSVAAVLNAKDAADMRDGYRTQLFNSRGVYGFTAGEAEGALAAKYRSQAEAVEAGGFHRVATTLRELAESYERRADLDSSRDPFDD